MVIWWIFICAVILLAIGAIFYIGINVCEDWDLLWVILFAISVVIELFVLETITVIMKVAFEVPTN